MRFHSDRRYELPSSPDRVWAHIGRVEQYPSWWPWLRGFDGERLAAGDVWACTVQPPLPYVVRFQVHLDEVVAPSHVQASVTGDVEGRARLELHENDMGSTARLVSDLGPGTQWLRAIARVASPVARFGHDWVLDSGARGFIRRSGAGAEGRDVA